ncbi:hypothetical protein AB0F46_42625 [Streptomyces sp. NPDC026665]|uniref:hypothetical protein n=1 Tax=Streptomyces sp. NPDC026665 TaxID=3154798 RepID=UPI003407C4F6
MFTGFRVHTGVGYVLLGGRVVVMERKAPGGQWTIPETEVRRAAAGLSLVAMDRQDLVQIGPFGGVPKQQQHGGLLMRWRQRIIELVQELDGRARRVGDQPEHLAGIDWRHILVEQVRDHALRTWWLPRAVVRLLDEAEHAERQWLQAVHDRQKNAAVPELSSPHPHTRTTDRPETSPDSPTVPLHPYNGELQGRLYSVLSRKPGISRTVAGWTCAVCRTAPASVLDH